MFCVLALQIVKNDVIENVIPIIISAKHLVSKCIILTVYIIYMYV